jgi:hypothetical protein
MKETEDEICKKLLDAVANAPTPNLTQAIQDYHTFIQAVSMRRSIPPLS